MKSNGFVLSDALVAIAAVSVCCTITAAALGVISASESGVHEVYEKSEEEYEDFLSGIGECVCETEETVLEEDGFEADT